MKYQHTTLYRIKGLKPQPAGIDKEIVFEPEIGFRAILTSAPDLYSCHGDRSNAIAGLMLGSFLGSGTPQKIETLVNEIQDGRRQEFGEELYLICLTEGNVDDFEWKLKEEIDDFVVCIDDTPASFNLASSRNINSVLSSLILSAENPLDITDDGRHLVFFQEDGKPVYSLICSSPRQGGTSEPLTQEILSSIEEYYKLLNSDQVFSQIEHVFVLLSISTNSHFDDMRTFHITWVAFESFVEMLGAGYKTKYSRSFSLPIGTGDFATIQRNIIGGHPGRNKSFSKIMVAFVWISAYLDGIDSDSDFMEVDAARLFRNNFVHETPQSREPARNHTQKIRKILRKYSLLHLIAEKNRT
jgi:hypothetical protein